MNNVKPRKRKAAGEPWRLEQSKGWILYNHGQNPKKDAKQSICWFTWKISQAVISIDLMDHLISKDRYMWLERNELERCLPQNVIEQLPTYVKEAVLCRFQLHSSDSVTTTGTATITIFCNSMLEQVECLSNPNAYRLLMTSIQEFILEDHCILPTSEILQRKKYFGYQATSQSFDIHYHPQVKTSLTSLQIQVLSCVYQSFQLRFMEQLGGLVQSSDGDYYAFSKQFQFLRKIPTCLLSRIHNLSGAVIATQQGTGKTLMALILSLHYATSNSSYVFIVVKNDLFDHWMREIKKHIQSEYHSLFHFVDSLASTSSISKSATILLINVDYLHHILPHCKCHMLVIDEAHTFKKASKRQFNSITNISFNKILLLTALPEKGPIDAIMQLDTIFYSLVSQLKYITTMRLTILNRITIRGSNPSSNILPIIYNFPSSDYAMKCYKQLSKFPYSNRCKLGTLYPLLMNIEHLNQTDQDKLEEQLRSNEMQLGKMELLLFQASEEGLSSKYELCAICHSPLFRPIQLGCRHIFCEECLAAWYKINPSCPTCRQSCQSIFLPLWKNTFVNQQQEQNQHQKEKEEAEWKWNISQPKETEINIKEKATITIYDAIKEYPNDAFLIYTNNDKFANQLYQASNKIRKTCIAGFTDQSRLARKTILEFQDKKFDVLILNISNYSDGLDFPDVGKMFIVGFDSIPNLLQAATRSGSFRLGSKIKETTVTIICNKYSIECFWATKAMYLLSQITTTKQDNDRNNNSNSSANSNSGNSGNSRSGIMTRNSKLPSEIQMLEMEYFLTNDEPNTRMYELKQLLLLLKLSPSIPLFQLNQEKKQQVVLTYKKKLLTIRLGTYCSQIISYGEESYVVLVADFLANPTLLLKHEKKK